MTDPSNINEVMAEIERRAIHTREGSFVKLDDVRKLFDDHRQQEADEKEKNPVPSRMTPEQARAAVKKDPEIMKHFPQKQREPAHSIPAQEPQPSSRT